MLAQTAGLTDTDATRLRIGAVTMLCVAFKLTAAVYCAAAIAVRLARA